MALPSEGYNEHLAVCRTLESGQIVEARQMLTDAWRKLPGNRWLKLAEAKVSIAEGQPKKSLRILVRLQREGLLVPGLDFEATLEAINNQAHTGVTTAI